MNEASLEDNKAIPDNYLKDTENKAIDILRRSGVNQQSMMRMMRLVQSVVQLQNGKESALEKLADDTIRENYGTILDNVILDLKLVKQGQVPPPPSDSEEQDDAKDELKRLNDDNIKAEVDKRKIANNIMQGEAKNTHRFIHMVKDKLDAIEPRLFPLYDEILKINEFFDWMIPMEVQKDMWEKMPGMFAGNVKVDWGDEDEDGDGEKEDLSAKILKDLEAGDDLENNEDAEELFSEGTPRITARCLDFPMLIHEAVKGIYELIAAVGIPEDEKTAELVLLNADTMSDEIEDLRYGPFIAGDLRDFISSISGWDRYPNIREHVFGKMMALPAGDFLKLVKSILMREESAKKKVKQIIDEIIDEIRDYEVDQIGREDVYSDDTDDTDSTSDDDDSSDFDLDDLLSGTGISGSSDVGHVSDDEPVPTKDKDYSKMSRGELNYELNKALDAGDYDSLDKIKKYLK